MMESKELATLSAVSRLTKLGTAGIAVIAGLISIAVTFYFSYAEHEKTSAINAQKAESIVNIENTNAIIIKENQSIIEIIENTNDPELKEKLNRYQENVEKLIKETEQAKEVLKNDVYKSDKGASLNISIISSARAAEDEQPRIKKQYVLWAILLLLALVYLGALYSLFFSRNSRNIDLATDLVKTLTGFYIGIATSVVA